MGGVSIIFDRQKSASSRRLTSAKGKTPIARCDEKAKYRTLAEIDRPGVHVVANSGGRNERFDHAHLHPADILFYPDNITIFDANARGGANVMITDASETRFQEKLHPGVLCAIHPDQPFDFAEKAYWMAFDPPLEDFVDQWLHLSIENGAYAAIYAKWFR